jgi:hypothetical protein
MVQNHGPNLSMRHPEIWRKGVVRKANAHFVRGEYEKCMNELSKMNICSIKRLFDEEYKKKWAEAQEAKIKTKLAGAFARRFPSKTINKMDNWFWSRITDFYDKDGDRPDEPSGDPRVKVVLKDAFDLIT